MTLKEALDIAYVVCGITESELTGILPGIEVIGFIDGLLKVSPKVKAAVRTIAAPEVLRELGLTEEPA